MIPKNIQRSHILKAITEIDRKNIPSRRRSKKYVLEYKGKDYPPKYVISLANKYANNVELDSSEFSGGYETNSFLRKLGFDVVEKGAITLIQVKEKIRYKKDKHNERCPECKKTIERMLKKIYGEVNVNYRFEIGTLPENFHGTKYYPYLKEIFSKLQEFRGHKHFVKSKFLPHCDFFVPNPGFIVEFDESQHFTICRKITLEMYPDELKLGFDRDRWIKLCEEINAKDNNPPYRDEQRAWYDTLRDFVPAIKGLKPTVRLFARDFRWCSLNSNNPSDVKRFKSLLKGKSTEWDIKIREDPEPFLARIIIAGDWEGKPEEAKKILEDIYKKWPKNKKVKFIITCGGFIQFKWPKSISRGYIGDNKNPNEEALNLLFKEGEQVVGYILSGGFDKKLGELTDYITLGVDSCKEKISTTQNYIGQLHIELVFLIDLRNKKIYRTGKSYPTSNQQDGLVGIRDLKTHFITLDVGKIMLLGCHDLTIFHPRSDAVALGWRRSLKEKFKHIAKRENPIIVLQHPHTTGCINVWTSSWNNLMKTLPSVKKYANAGRWPHITHHLYRKGKKKGKAHCKLEDVLEKTKNCNSIDFIISIR